MGLCPSHAHMQVAYGLVSLWTATDGEASGAAAAEHLTRCDREGRSDVAVRACKVAVGGGGGLGGGLGIIRNWMEDMIGKTDALHKADWLVVHDYFYKDVDTHPLSPGDLIGK